VNSVEEDLSPPSDRVNGTGVSQTSRATRHRSPVPPSPEVCTARDQPRTFILRQHISLTFVHVTAGQRFPLLLLPPFLRSGHVVSMESTTNPEALLLASRFQDVSVSATLPSFPDHPKPTNERDPASHSTFMVSFHPVIQHSKLLSMYNLHKSPCWHSW